MAVLLNKLFASDFRYTHYIGIDDYLAHRPLPIQKILPLDIPPQAIILPQEVNTQNFKSLFHVAAGIFDSMEQAREKILQHISLENYYVISKDDPNHVEQLTFNHLLQENYWISNTLSGLIFDSAKEILKTTVLGSDPLFEAGKQFGLPLSTWKTGLMKYMSMKQLVFLAKLRNETYNKITNMQVIEKKGMYRAVYTYRDNITKTTAGYPISGSVCDWNRGVFTYFVNLLGKKDVSVVETHCVTRGDTTCIFEGKFASEPLLTRLQKSLVSLIAPGLFEQYEQAIQQAEITKRKLQEIVDKQLLELQQKNLELARLNTIDQLTQIKNRGFFNSEIKRLCSLCLRDDSHVSVIMIDIDHFKNINDTYGHPFGDICLQTVAQAIQQKELLHRDNDFVARYGGEEFVVVLPATDLAGAIMVAERIRKTIAAIKIPYSNKKISLTISAGVSTGNLPEEIIGLADKALYRAKNLGRNRVEKEDGGR